MRKVFCIVCGNVQESKGSHIDLMHKGDFIWSESCNICGRNALEVMQ